MEWIYLSPHLDDVALSCGGLIWEQVRAGEVVSVWTICAGDPPPGPFSSYAKSLHKRWETGVQAAPKRRTEDLESCQRMGATPRHFSIPDCIYRLSPVDGAVLYDSEEAIFEDLHAQESGLVVVLSQELAHTIPPEANLVCPLAIGGHVDHRLTRRAAERLNQSLWYYADYPYVTRRGAGEDAGRSHLKAVLFPVSEAGLEAWVEAVAAHTSQISTFWPDLASMQVDIQDYCHQVGGVHLWVRSVLA